jgi:VIT1/CCC1 family predicted Fe2+/Mn2+ transporter
LRESGVEIVKLPKNLAGFSFGATSCTTTSLGLVFGFLESSNPRASIIGSLLLIAVADNIADSLGFHIYRESASTETGKIGMFTVSNFLTRFGITGLFVVFFAFLPLQTAALLCIIVGLGVLSFLSYMIGIHRKTNPLREVLIHLGVVIPVILISHFIGQIIFTTFG